MLGTAKSRYRNSIEVRFSPEIYFLTENLSVAFLFSFSEDGQSEIRHKVRSGRGAEANLYSFCTSLQWSDKERSKNVCTGTKV